MKKFFSLFLCMLSMAAFSQTTPLSFTAISTSADDLFRPGAGAEEWKLMNYAAIPHAGTYSTMTDAYNRMEYTDIQKYDAASNVYDFTVFDQHINQCIDRGQWFSFSVEQMCNFCTGGNGNNQPPGFPAPGGAFLYYPLWLHNAMQTETVKDINVGGVWYPNYNSPTWLAAWKAMHVALHNHILSGSYNGINYKDVINCIDVAGYGNTAEWTINTEVIGKPQEPTIASMDSIINYTVKTYREFQCVGQIALFEAQQTPGNTNIPAAVGYYALTITNDKGKIGIRRESLGNTSALYDNWTINNTTVYNGLNFGTEISNRWKIAPWTGEPCNCGDTYAALQGQMDTYHMSSFGNGNQYSPSTSIDGYFRAASKEAGYRIILTGGSTVTSPTTGASFPIVLKWQNVGVAPPYRDWNVIFRLKNGTTILKTFTSSFNPNLFLPTNGVDNTITDNFNLSGVAAGSGYTLTVSVEDPKGYKKPMPLFITTAQNPDGSYTLRTGITVGNPSGTPVANAGADQTITAPTASVTLDGTGSSGTITSYTWSQVSGPNTAGIITPTTVTTTVTSLIPGTYIFQLLLNGGSTSVTHVKVNPSIPPSSTIFTTQTPVATTDNDIPGGANTFTGQEIGVRFQSTIPGYVTGIRFYKTAGNIGTHTGELYNNTGTRLAQAVFQNETATGWQTASIAPILIAANTTYVAAYFSGSGYYVEDNHYFDTKAVVNTNLSALVDGRAGGDATPDLTFTTNGPYKYCSTPSFPNNAYHGANYWVDIVFSIQTPNTIILNKSTNINFIKVVP